jgi:hypothetical protein
MMMRLARAGLAAGFCLATVSMAFAQDIPRFRGQLDRGSYPLLAKKLFSMSGKPVAFDVTIPLDNDESKGHLTTFVLDGQFELAWLAGKKGSKVYADTGFDLVDDSYYTLKGVFTVGSIDKDDDGVPTLLLDEVQAKAGATFSDIDTATLKTGN